MPTSSTANCRRPAPLPAASGPVSANISAGRCPTAPRWPNLKTSPGCSPPTRATVWRGVEAAGDESSLAAVRSALEQALGVRFEGDRGAAFFRSTLVQTLFYGVFSRLGPVGAPGAPRPPVPSTGAKPSGICALRFLRALFLQLSDPGPLAAAGPRRGARTGPPPRSTASIRDAFFNRFNEGEAVPYFYEPFLQAFDPALRKQLGVWYTPTEVVRYMVARVDRALRGRSRHRRGAGRRQRLRARPVLRHRRLSRRGVLRRIASNLQDQGLGALTGARVRQAALERVFRIRDHARAVRRRPLAGRPHHAGPRRAAGRRRGRARRRVSHQRPSPAGSRPCRSRCRSLSLRKSATAPNESSRTRPSS